MLERSRICPVSVLLILSCLCASLPLAAAPLSEPDPWVWQQVASFGSLPVRGAQVFTIGDAAYVVSGMPDSCIPRREVWKYDSVANSWTRMGDYPGTPIIEGVGFSIGDMGYICLGNVNVTPDAMAEFWQYNPGGSGRYEFRTGDSPIRIWGVP
jgi:hypothetical protein